jgi:hypothetical protein
MDNLSLRDSIALVLFGGDIDELREEAEEGYHSAGLAYEQADDLLAMFEDKGFNLIDEERR